MIDNKLRHSLNQISKFCFRDVADNDYLAARILFRYEMVQQAYWCSQQAVEKYFKSILLFNEVSTKMFGHNLEKALLRIENIPKLNVDLPTDVREIIAEINNEGKNRYYEYPYSFSKLTYFNLDRVVWYIRRYCIPANILLKVGNKEIDLQEFNLAISHDKKYNKYPSKYKFPSQGILEKILLNKKSIMREQLVWKNGYYGLRQKHKLKNVKTIQRFGNPPHFDNEYEIDEINNYVQFSKDVLDYLRNEV